MHLVFCKRNGKEEINNEVAGDVPIKQLIIMHNKEGREEKTTSLQLVTQRSKKGLPEKLCRDSYFDKISGWNLKHLIWTGWRWVLLMHSLLELPAWVFYIEDRRAMPAESINGPQYY
jgi:hypothetical protein